MNKAINMLLLLLTFPVMAVTIYVGFDLPIDFLRVSGKDLPYRFEVFLFLGTLIFLVLARRSVKRWMGSQIVKRKERFKWNIAVGPDRTKRVITYLSLEAMVMAALAYGMYTITHQAWAPAGAFLIGAVDSVLFALIGWKKNWFRIGLSSKALIVADREVSVLYFTGLRKISIHQQSVYFDYIKGLQLTFPLDCIPKDQREVFFHELEKSVDLNKVFFEHKKF
jgi:hypothetical protein